MDRSSKLDEKLLNDLRSWFEQPNGQTPPGFESSALADLKLQSISVGHAVFTFRVAGQHLNAHGTLHGGCIATLVDVVGSAAIATHGPLRHVSTDMNQTYLRPTVEGTLVTVESKCLRSGGRLAFADVELWRPALDAEETAAARADRQVMVALGRHTKYILKNPLPKSRL